MSIPDTLKDCFLDHIAIAVDDLESAIKIYEDLGLNFSPHRERVDTQKVITAFAAIDKNARIELLQATSEESTIAKFIAKQGAGIHHLCFRVNDIELKQQELLTKGYRFIYPKAQIGADHCLVNFIHPKDCGGVLIELSQKIINQQPENS